MRIIITAAFIFSLSLCNADESGKNVRIVNITNNTTNFRDSTSKINSGIDLGGNKKLEESVVKGSGKTDIKKEKLPAFSEIKVKNGMSIKVDASAGKPELQVTGDDNIIPLVKAKVVKGVLNFSYSDSFTTGNALKITVTAPKLKTITATGASRVTINKLDVKEIKIIGRQGTQITASGKAGLLVLVLSNAASFNGTKLVAKNAKVKMDIATSADLNVTDQVSGTNNLGSCSFVNKPLKNTLKKTNMFSGFSK
tara:strand:- start:271 stop:1029 length:759 start_codon:yes stop_codon:yes gene_type:complete